jgi:4-hydroxy-tetrahydrodipicolinate reductase
MKIALIGYGKMGREIEKIILERGHETSVIIDVDNPGDFDTPAFVSSTDVAIEFTRPESAFGNYLRCFERRVPVVAGTTGWLQHLDAVRKACRDEGQSFFYSSNYSVGMQLFFALNRRLAHWMNRFSEYDVRIEEIHHVHKLDAPSGSALTAADAIAEQIDRVDRQNLVIESKRRGEAPGTHTVVYESDCDSIRVCHEAKNRKGFALGAVLAAEFICGKTGFFTMDDLLNL